MSNTRLFLLVIAMFAAGFAAQRFLNPSEHAAAAIEAAEARLTHVVSKDLPPLLAAAKGKPTLVLIYTSWCPNCRTSLRTLEAMHAAGELNNSTPIFISLDKDSTVLAEYTLSHPFLANYPLYVLHPDKHSSSPTEALKAIAPKFAEGIPHFAFYNARGKLIHEQTGDLTREQLKANLR